jgi:hypothetical protein
VVGTASMGGKSVAGSSNAGGGAARWLSDSGRLQLRNIRSTTVDVSSLSALLSSSDEDGAVTVDLVVVVDVVVVVVVVVVGASWLEAVKRGGWRLAVRLMRAEKVRTPSTRWRPAWPSLYSWFRTALKGTSRRASVP